MKEKIRKRGLTCAQIPWTSPHRETEVWETPILYSKKSFSATQIWNSTTNFDLSTPIFNYHHHTIIVMYKTAQKQHKTQIPPTTDKSELKITQRIPFSNPNSHEHENWEHFKDYITKSNLKLKSTITSFVFLGFEVLKIRKEERERMVELAFLDALYSTRVFLFYLKTIRYMYVYLSYKRSRLSFCVIISWVIRWYERN
jgi:hypothetical protein